MKDSELVRILDKYKYGGIVDESDQHILDILSPDGYIRYQFLKLFASDMITLAYTTQLGNEILEMYHGARE